MGAADVAAGTQAMRGTVFGWLIQRRWTWLWLKLWCHKKRLFSVYNCIYLYVYIYICIICINIYIYVYYIYIHIYIGLIMVLLIGTILLGHQGQTNCLPKRPEIWWIVTSNYPNFGRIIESAKQMVLPRFTQTWIHMMDGTADCRYKLMYIQFRNVRNCTVNAKTDRQNSFRSSMFDPRAYHRISVQQAKLLKHLCCSVLKVDAIQLASS